jgi:uncharacterized protein
MITIPLIRVSSLQSGSNPIHESVPADLLEIKPYHGCEVTLTGPARADLSLFKEDGQVLASGRIDFRARLVCADCAGEFEQSFSEPVSIEYYRDAPPDSGSHVGELGEDELARIYYEGHELDLLPMIRDTILLAIPIAPLCRPDCKGICPECGANLNREECQCASAVPVAKTEGDTLRKGVPTTAA